MNYTATYSPEDNKLRLYASSRLDAETYATVKGHGFSWAPKQELFVAPMWTPEREDFLLSLVDEIEDEDISMADRAAERADRFDSYSDHRERDAQSAEAAVHQIADGIPFGQPILVGHHSERHARRDAEKIQNGMRRAVKMWETSAYWVSRAQGAISNADYKARPDVRARRIKGIEADLRRVQREQAKQEMELRFWNCEMKRKDGAPMELTYDLVTSWLNHSYCYGSWSFPLDRYPRSAPASMYEGPTDLWSALGGSDGLEYAIITIEQAKELSLKAIASSLAFENRWIGHYENRLAYERALLEASGYKPPEKKKSLKETLPLLNYRAETITFPNPYRDGSSTVKVIEMTKAEYASIYDDHKGTRIIGGTHRYRIAYKIENHAGCYYGVFLSDSKVHDKPTETAMENAE